MGLTFFDMTKNTVFQKNNINPKRAHQSGIEIWENLKEHLF
jgi:hypothetical protein